ncbi:MAG: molybdopterin-dependent oxidoreductase [Anaeromyxobacteraceae bacterium]
MTDILKRIEEGREMLRKRFGEAIRATPSLADREPQGSGPANRHGMPQVPPRQNVLSTWPVLDCADQPVVSTDRWELRIEGEVEEPVRLHWADFLGLPQAEDVSDFHCVTGWSRLDMRWEGVRFETLAALVRPTLGATHVMFHSYDGYSTNLPLEEALKPDVLLAHRVDGEPLSTEHGGPVRVVTPQLWAWKGAKWVRRVEFMPHDRRGYWEIRGYSNTAWPWRDDRDW